MYYRRWFPQCAMECDLAYKKRVSADVLVGFTEQAKIQWIQRVFEDAYRTNGAVIILDDIERLVEYVPLGQRFSNAVLQALLVLIKKPPPKNVRALTFLCSPPLVICSLEAISGVLLLAAQAACHWNDQQRECVDGHGRDGRVQRAFGVPLCARISVKGCVEPLFSRLRRGRDGHVSVGELAHWHEASAAHRRDGPWRRDRHRHRRGVSACLRNVWLPCYRRRLDVARFFLDDAPRRLFLLLAFARFDFVARVGFFLCVRVAPPNQPEKIDSLATGRSVARRSSGTMTMWASPMSFRQAYATVSVGTVLVKVSSLPVSDTCCVNPAMNNVLLDKSKAVRCCRFKALIISHFAFSMVWSSFSNTRMLYCSVTLIISSFCAYKLTVTPL